MDYVLCIPNGGDTEMTVILILGIMIFILYAIFLVLFKEQ